MKNIEVYTKDNCPYCDRAKALLQAKGETFTTIDVTHDTDALQKMINRSTKRSVPQIFINGQSIGGYTDLAKMYT